MQVILLEKEKEIIKNDVQPIDSSSLPPGKVFLPDVHYTQNVHI